MEEKPKTKENEQEDANATATDQPNDEFENGTLFDLQTTRGQFIFLLLSVAASVVLQSFTKEPVKIKSTEQSNEIIQMQSAMLNEIPSKPLYAFHSTDERYGHLRYVKLVLDGLGFGETSYNATNWDLLWSWDYPFSNELNPRLMSLQSHQRVNHFPGCGFIASKVDLATTDSKYIPKAFRLPKDRDQFIKYAEENPTKLFVQKGNNHQNIQIKNITEINFDDSETFLQEFVDNPLLVDGHKFDIGVYVIITSVDPLRIYIYKGDYLIRYCPAKYYPFDAKNVDKYIISTPYMPTREVPALAPYFEKRLGFGYKDAFEVYLRSKGRDPNVIWRNVEDAIRDAILSKEKYLADYLKQYRWKRSFFEMMRIDLIVDENLNVYLMEANMSPNLFTASERFYPNIVLYEQVLFNLFNLVGVGSPVHRESMQKQWSDLEQMLSADKNIVTFGEKCASEECERSCNSPDCQLCRPCLTNYEVEDLHTAYREHMNRGDCKRIFPVSSYEQGEKFEKLSPSNQWMVKWFAGKCAIDDSWCS